MVIGIDYINNRIAYFQSLLFKSTFVKNIGITFFETITTKSINFLIILILTRALGPEEYGKYSFIFVIMAFCAAFFDFGMENTAVRFSAKEKQLSNSIFGLYFIIKLSILITSVFILIFFGEYIFNLMHKAHMAIYLPYLIIGLIGESLFFVNNTYLQAIQKFNTRAILNITRYSLYLIIVLMLYFTNTLLLKYIFLIYFIPLIISFFFVYKYFCFLKSFFLEKLNTTILKEIFHYEKWMLVLSIGNNILGRIDFLMLSFLVGFEDLGLYNAAFQFAAIFSFVPFVLGKVILPKISEKTPEEIFAFTQKLLKWFLFIGILMCFLIPLAPFLIKFMLGEAYSFSGIILIFLLLLFVISLIFLPIEQAFYALGTPKYISLSKYCQILIVVVFNLIFIPQFGILAAAINVFIAKFLVSFILYIFYIKQKKEIYG